MAASDSGKNSTDKMPIIVDMGKHSGKKVRGLLRGEGPLLSEVNQTLRELQNAGKIGSNVQPVVFVVRKKDSSLFKL